jgi:hypothetical protein
MEEKIENVYGDQPLHAPQGKTNLYRETDLVCHITCEARAEDISLLASTLALSISNL